MKELWLSLLIAALVVGLGHSVERYCMFASSIAKPTYRSLHMNGLGSLPGTEASAPAAPVVAPSDLLGDAD